MTWAKCCARGFVEKVGDLGERVDDLLIVGVLGVEDAEGIGLGAALVVLAHLVLYGLEGFAEGFDVAWAVVAEPTELRARRQPLMPSSSRSVASISRTSASRRGALGAGPGGADDLGADLPELAVAAALWALAAELRADVEELLQQAGLVELVLDVGADYAGGVFGAQGEGLRLFARRRGARSSQVYISLETMSVSSPTPRAKSSVVSKIGVRISPKP